MNKSIKLGGVFAVVMATAFTISSAMAYQGNPTQEGPNCSPERHTEIKEVMENNDYETWRKLMTDRGRITQVINEENFSQFAEAHKLSQAGDIAGADAIREGLGFRTSGGEKIGAGYKGQGRAEGDRQGYGKMNSEYRGQNNL